MTDTNTALLIIAIGVAATEPFAHLTPEVISKVVDKFIYELEAQLADRSVAIDLTDDAKEWLAKKGFDPQYGARPLARIIQEHIKKPLAEEVLFGKLEKGGTVEVYVKGKGKDKTLSFNYVGIEKPAPKKAVKSKPARKENVAASSSKKQSSSRAKTTTKKSKPAPKKGS